MKSLKEILYKAGLIEVFGSTDITVNDVCFDSRKVKMESVFVAARGTQVDGHDFINQVIEKGCRAIICEKFPNGIKKEVTYVRVNDSSKALSIIAANFYDNPSEKLKLVGVTGTNGKTTTATLLFHL